MRYLAATELLYVMYIGSVARNRMSKKLERLLSVMLSSILPVATIIPILVLDKGKDHRVNYTTGRNLCNGRNLVELVAVKCTTPVMEYDV